MSKANLLLVLAFVVVCAAGVVVGTAFDRQMRPPIAPPPPGPFGLNLSPDQLAQMKKIWGKFDEARHQLYTQQRQYDHDRRAAYESLLTPEQLAQYKKIQADYEAKAKDLDEQRHHAADLAVAESDKILTPEQSRKLHEMRDHMHGGPGMGPPPGMGGPRNHHDRSDFHRPTTEPATMPHADPQ